MQCRGAGTPSSTQVAEAMLHHVVCRHGLPDTLLSDQGTGFCMDVMRSIAMWLGVEQKTTSPYHPQCNGLTERFNRTFIGMLRTYPGVTNMKEWDERLPLLLFAYRCHYHLRARRSPFFMLYGRMPRLPGAVFDGIAARVQTRSQWLREVMDYLPDTWNKAIAELEAQARLIRAKTGLAIAQGKLKVYAIGDKVRVWDHKADSHKVGFKDQRVWRGPCTVLRVITPSTYEVEEVDSHGLKFRHVVWSGNMQPASDAAQQRPDIRNVLGVMEAYAYDSENEEKATAEDRLLSAD